VFSVSGEATGVEVGFSTGSGQSSHRGFQNRVKLTSPENLKKHAAFCTLRDFEGHGLRRDEMG